VADVPVPEREPAGGQIEQISADRHRPWAPIGPQ
jgi:hypothetical protein